MNRDMSLKDIIGSAAADLYRTNNKVYQITSNYFIIESNARCRNIFWNKAKEISDCSYSLLLLFIIYY